MEYMNLINQIGLETILKSIGLNVKDKGSYYSTSCPSGNHDDKDPSWVLYKKNAYHICFACDFRGSIYHLVWFITGKNFNDFFNLENTFIPDVVFHNSLERKRKVRESFKEREHRLEIKGKMYNIFNGPMPSQIQEYLDKRRISDKFLKDFDIKYCEYIEINGTKFYNRLLTPIIENGKMISIEGRDFTGRQSKKVLYPKGGTVNTLWNIDDLDHKKTLIVCEGILDTHKIYTHFTENVTCTFGIQITSRQKELLKKFDRIILFPDDDEGGERFISIFDSFYENEFYICKVPGKDPGDATISELEKELKKTIPANRYLLERYDILHPSEKFIWKI